MCKFSCTTSVKIIRHENNQAQNRYDQVACEREIIVRIEKSLPLVNKNAQYHHPIPVQDVSLFCSPKDLRALISGFLLTRGFIKEIGEIKKIARNKNIFHVFLSAQKILLPSKKKRKVKILAARIFKLAAALQKKQKIFAATGGTHAALVFNRRYEILAFAEDLARHNTIDKVIGKCLIKKRGGEMYGIILSSRVTKELVEKISLTPIQLIAAISAPTSLAIQTAKKAQIALCGFVRKQKMNIYL